jgi:ABC-type lipoprotein release transport system permease subunit
MDAAFTVPWDQLGLMLAGTLLAALLATLQPAIRAVRIRPAEVLRSLE